VVEHSYSVLYVVVDFVVVQVLEGEHVAEGWLLHLKFADERATL